jgi:ATP-dependent helicase/nuclease subunit A
LDPQGPKPLPEPVQDAGRVCVPQGRKPFLEPVQAAISEASPVPASLSYTALATYEQCGYRFYVQRVLGLPDLSSPMAPPASEDEERSAAAAATAAAATAAAAAPAAAAPAPRAGLGGAQRGTQIHHVLAGIDLRTPSLRDAMPADVRALLAGLIGSTSFGRLATIRDVSREQRFAFPVGDTLITGVFDVIAQDRPGHLLVLDYKSDRLAGVDPEVVVSERYLAQRLIYALAALKLGAPAVEVVHLFLEAPEDPVAAEFGAAEIPALEQALAERVAGVLAGEFRVTNAPGRRTCDGCPAQGGLCSHPIGLTTR